MFVFYNNPSVFCYAKSTSLYTREASELLVYRANVTRDIIVSPRVGAHDGSDLTVRFVRCAVVDLMHNVFANR